MYGTERQRLGHRLAVAINTHRRQRLNAYPEPHKPSKRLAWILGAMLVIAVGTCSGILVSMDPEEPERPSLVELKGYRLVSEFTYTGAGGWPFTVDEARLFCEENAVWVETGGTLYPLNGTAKSLLPRLRPGARTDALPIIWRDDPRFDSNDFHSTKINIGPMIEKGLRLCGG